MPDYGPSLSIPHGLLHRDIGAIITQRIARRGAAVTLADDRKFHYVVYKITFPNGKIYIGKDIGRLGHTIRYFGSWNYDRVARDFTKEELSDFTIRRTILFESTDKREVGRREMELIVEHGANNPKRGYNMTPRHRPTDAAEARSTPLPPHIT